MDEERLKVLIVEDETIIRLDLCSLLERQGFEVCGEARDGLEAVELARATEPDVALVDVKMPRLDGIEASLRMLAERPLPIVLLTAYADRGLVRRAVEAGVSGYLVKPFREQDVVPALRTAVARHRELVDARRQVGAKPPRPVDLDLRSGDRSWPLRIGRRPDGSIDVSVRRPLTGDAP